MALRNHLELIAVLPLTEPISSRFVELMEAYSLSHKLAIPDALIAATALTHHAPLYTLNLKDFRFIPDLVLFEP